MDYLTVTIIAGIGVAGVGIIVGYYIRQSIAKRRAGTLEAKLQKKVTEAKELAASTIKEAEQKSRNILEKTQKEIDERRKEFLNAEKLLLSREGLLNERISSFEVKEKEIQDRGEKLKLIKEDLEKLRKEAAEKLEKVAELSRDDAKKELLSLVEIQSERDILERMRKLEEKGKEKLEARAKDIVALAIQKVATPQTQELSTSTVVLENEGIKGKIIGKEGRNIRTFEKLTGVELIVDETPESVVISCFNPIRRQIAKVALEKLIQDGRIQ